MALLIDSGQYRFERLGRLRSSSAPAPSFTDNEQYELESLARPTPSAAPAPSAVVEDFASSYRMHGIHGQPGFSIPFEDYLSATLQLLTVFPHLNEDYSLFKGKLSLFSKLVSLNDLRRSSTSIHFVQILADEETNPLEYCLQDLRSILKTHEVGCLRICMITSAVDSNIHDVLPVKSQLFDTQARLQQRNQTPNVAVLITVLEAWGLPKDVLLSYVESGRVGQMLTPYTTFPSRNETAQVFKTHDPDWISIRLKWQQQAPRYRSDFDVYVWQPHTTVPDYRGASILVSVESWRILVSWRMAAAVSSFQDYITHVSSELSKRFVLELGNREVAIAAVLSIYAFMIKDTHNFLDTLLEEIAILTMAGRRNPRASKTNFLLHLNDCRQASAVGVRDARTLLKRITSHFDLNKTHMSGHKELLKWTTEISSELDVLGESLKEVGETIAEVRAMIKEQIDLGQIKLSGILAVLAAIYLPFSFISGMFGMNISDPLWYSLPATANSVSAGNAASQATAIDDVIAAAIPSSSNDAAVFNPTSIPSTFFTISSTNSDHSTPAVQITAPAETQTTVAETASSGPHLWTFKEFIYIGISITAATIILPLFAGSTLRIMLRSFNSYGTYWGIEFLLPGVTALIFLNIFVPPLACTIITCVPHILFAIWQWALTVRRKQHKKRWYGYISILMACLSIDLSRSTAFDLYTSTQFGKGIGVTGFIPTVCLIAIGIQTDRPSLTRNRVSDIRTRMSNWRYITKLRENTAPFYLKWYKWIGWASILCVFGLNIVLQRTIPGTSYLAATSIPLLLYSFDVYFNMPPEESTTFTLIWMYYVIVIALITVLHLVFQGESAELGSKYFPPMYFFAAFQMWVNPELAGPFNRLGSRESRQI